MTNNYAFQTFFDWESFGHDNPELRQKIIEQPLELWLDRTTKDDSVQHEESVAVWASSFFELDSGLLVAKDANVASRILAERYAKLLLLPAWDDGQEFRRQVDKLHRFCILNNDYASAFPDAVVLLHNQYHCDVIRRATGAFQSQQKSDSFWQGVSTALPFLNLELQQLILLFDEAIASCAKGFIGFEAYNCALRLGATQPEFSMDLIEVIKSPPDRPSIALLSNFAIGLSRDRFEEMFDAAFDWIGSTSDSLVAQGFYALGAFDYSADNRGRQKRKYFDLLNRPFEEKPNEALVALAFSIKKLLKSDDAEVIDWLTRLSKVRRSEINCAVASVLLDKQKDFSERPWFREILNNLVTATDQNPSLVANIDFTLHGISESDIGFVLNYIERWILNHNYDSRVSITATFNSTFSQLGNKGLAHHEYLVTRWFLSDDNRLHRAASEIVDDLAGATLGGQFDIFHLDRILIAEIGDADSAYLMRKILGFVHDRRLLASLAFSIMNCGEKAKNKGDLVTWAFRTFVGYNYYGAATELLSKKMSEGSDQEKRVAKDCSDELKDYFDSFDGPIPKELQPPRLRVDAYHKEVNKLYRQAKEGAMAASPLLSIFKTKQLLFGRTSAFAVGDGQTQFSDLNSYMHTFEESRGDTINPLGMRYLRWRWQFEQRGKDEVDN